MSNVTQTGVNWFSIGLLRGDHAQATAPCHQRKEWTNSSDAAVNQPEKKAPPSIMATDAIASGIRNIASVTSFTNAAIFKHYDTKEALALDLFERCYAALALSVTSSIHDFEFNKRMHGLVMRYLDFMKSVSEAAHYVRENLRRYWSKLPKNAARISLLGHLGENIQAGQRQGVVAVDKEPRLLVAVVIGLLGQFARMLYFNEFQGPATRYAQQLSELAIDACRPK